MSDCAWPVDYTACGAPDWDTEGDGNDAATFEAMAVDLLNAWTGGRFGVCEVAIRPCRTPCDGTRPPTFYGRGPRTTGGVWQPVRAGDVVGVARCGYCSTSCCCSTTKKWN